MATPVDANQKLTEADDGTCDSETVDQEMYQSAVGSFAVLINMDKTRHHICCQRRVQAFCRANAETLECSEAHFALPDRDSGLRSDLQEGSL